MVPLPRVGSPLVAHTSTVTSDCQCQVKQQPNMKSAVLQGALDAAEQLFVKARNIDPTDASVHQHYGLSASLMCCSRHTFCLCYISLCPSHLFLKLQYLTYAILHCFFC